jgi:hypothetical protein
MVQNRIQHRIERTVVIGAGDAGLAVIQAFRRRLAERWGTLPTVACISVVGKAGTVPNDGSPTVSLPIKAESATRPQARETLRAANHAVITTLVEALTQVSRIRQREAFQLKRWSVNWPEEVAFYVIAALDDPLGGGLFLDLAYLARHLASQRLNAPTRLTGLFFLPDVLSPDDPRPALARAYAALRELDVLMSPHNGYTAQWADGLQVQGWGPAFDRGCYLMGALNAEGLGLEKPKGRIELAAEALLQLAVTPMAGGCESPLMPLWSMGERPHNYGALGLAAWVYPCETLVEALARRLAGEILAAWLGSGASDSTRTTDGQKNADQEAEAFLVRCNMGPADAAETVLPADLLREAGLWRPLKPQLSLTRARRFRQDLEDDAAERLESLATQRPELDRCAEALGRELSQRLAQVVDQRLDRAAPGRVFEAEALLTGVEQQLDTVLTETQRAADAHWRDLEALDDQLERVGEEMDRLAACFPELTWQTVLAMLFKPRRLVSLILAYRDLSRAGATYEALLARQMALAIEVLRRDLVVEVYEEALKGMQDERVQLASLIEAVRTARQSLTITQAKDVGLSLAEAFELERSVLTPESIEALYASVHGDLTDLLVDIAQAQRPLSAWLRTGADGESIAAACLDFTHRRCQVLDEITADELLLESLGDGRETNEALQGLLELASPFLGWDETRLRGPEHQVMRTCTALGLGDGVASPLLEGLGDIPWAQVVATGESQRVTALTMVRGLPLAALAGLQEYATAYQAADPEHLHTAPDWTDLPDPVEDVVFADSPVQPDEVPAESFPRSSQGSHEPEEADDDRRI